MHNVAGNTKLVTLSDAVKLAVDGNLQIPGSIILTLKKYYKVESEEWMERGRGREAGSGGERETMRYIALLVGTELLINVCGGIAGIGGHLVYWFRGQPNSQAILFWFTYK